MNVDALTIRNMPGELPPMWERRVVFVANLLGLFFGNANETRELRRQVGPIESYGGRLVPVLGLLFRGHSPNLVVLERTPDARLLAYFKHDLVLPLPEVAVLSHDAYASLSSRDNAVHPDVTRFVDQTRDAAPRWLDGFVTDPALERLAALLGCRTISSAQASLSGNNKLLLHQHLVASGLPVFDTHVAERPPDLPAALAELRRLGYAQAVVKAPIGASGIGIVRVATDGDASSVPRYLFHEGPCLVQGWLDASCAGVTAVHSPSVQLFLDDTSLSFFDITGQILDTRSIHEGNIAPPPWLDGNPDTRAELLRQAEIAGVWLYQRGYRGTASVDFHVAERAGRMEVRVCEINARVTGATYPSLLARHFTTGGAWLMRNLRFEQPVSGHDVLTALDDAGSLFRPGAAEGILPINFNPDASGAIVKGQFLCLARTPAQTIESLEKACAVLPVRGVFDRD
ncbi:MAG: ATP-grasp domain-containing protein [Opitutaceae bacterium]